ncbi:MAG: TauD/TfdA family dioxygenase, partial [Pseudomonadota bacterium]
MSTAVHLGSPESTTGKTATPEVRPITDAIGADVIGLNLEALPAAHFRHLRQALLDHCVVRLRGYAIDDDKQVELGRMFGAVVGTSVGRDKNYDWSKKYP